MNVCVPYLFFNKRKMFLVSYTTVFYKHFNTHTHIYPESGPSQIYFWLKRIQKVRPGSTLDPEKEPNWDKVQSEYCHRGIQFMIGSNKNPLKSVLSTSLFVGL